jgi:hypothetical protein
MARRLLKLTWTDATGTIYHTDEVSPRVARQMIALDMGRLFIANVEVYVGALSWAEVKRQPRAPYAILQGDRIGHQIVIDIA